MEPDPLAHITGVETGRSVTGRKNVQLGRRVTANGETRWIVRSIGVPAVSYPEDRAHCLDGQHLAPHPGCRCGFNAYHHDTSEATELAVTVTSTGVFWAVADVTAAGVVIVAERGWRAEVQTVTVLTVPDRCDRCEVPIQSFALNDAGDVVGRCASCHPSFERVTVADLAGHYRCDIERAGPVTPRPFRPGAGGDDTHIGIASGLLAVLFLAFTATATARMWLDAGDVSYRTITGLVLTGVLGAGWIGLWSQIQQRNRWPSRPFRVGMLGTVAALLTVGSLPVVAINDAEHRYDDAIDTAAATIREDPGSFDAQAAALVRHQRADRWLGGQGAGVHEDGSGQPVFVTGFHSLTGRCRIIDAAGGTSDLSSGECSDFVDHGWSDVVAVRVSGTELEVLLTGRESSELRSGAH